MSAEPTAPTPTDQATNDPAPPAPTRLVAAGEIAQFLRHLTDLRTSGHDNDPAARAAFLHRKTELFARLAAIPNTPAGAPTPERRTP